MLRRLVSNSSRMQIIPYYPHVLGTRKNVLIWRCYPLDRDVKQHTHTLVAQQSELRFDGTAVIC